MPFNFNADTPIYLQIIEYIKAKIICGEFDLGGKLPSVRDLSFDLGVNPNTIQKALGELENLKIIYTERTNGKFVTSDPKVIQKIREQTVKKRCEKFWQDMKDLGATDLEIINKLKEIMGD